LGQFDSKNIVAKGNVLCVVASRLSKQLYNLRGKYLYNLRACNVFLSYPSKHNPRAPSTFVTLFIFFRVHHYAEEHFRVHHYKLVSCTNESALRRRTHRISCTAYKLIVFIALKNPFLVDCLMFVVCMVTTDIDPNLMIIQYF